MGGNLLTGQRFFYGWVVVAVGFITLGLGFGVWYSFTVFFLAVMKEFDWSRASTSLAFSAFVIVYGVSGPPVGVLVHRFGARRVMPLGALLLAAALAASSLIQQPWQFYITFGLLAAIGLGAVGMVPNYAVAGHWFVKRRGLVVGILSAGVGALGILTMVPLNEYLVSTIGWRGAYLVLAGIIVVVMPTLVYALLRDRPQDMGLLPDGVAALANGRACTEQVAREGSGLPADPTLREALRSWRFWVLIIAVGLTSLSSQGFLVHAAPYMVDLGYSTAFAASMVGLVGLISVPSKIGWGLAFDRIGRERSFTLGVLCMASCMVLLTVLPGLTGVWPMYLATFLFALGYSVTVLMSPMVTGDLFGSRHYGMIYGYVSLASSLGSAAGPFLAGYVFDNTGSYTPAFLTYAVTIVLSCVLIWVVAPRRARLATSAPSGYDG